MQLNKIFEKNSYIYLERYVNTFKKVSNEVSSQYCAISGDKEFHIPCIILSKNDIKILTANPYKKVYSKIVSNKVKFFIHPDMIEEIAKNLNLTKINNKIIAEPTSSTRTVLPIGENFAIKLHLNKRLSKYIRRLRPSSVEHSVMISKEMEMANGEFPPTFAYLPESIGIIYKEIGMIIREITPCPLISDKEHLFPFFLFIQRI